MAFVDVTTDFEKRKNVFLVSSTSNVNLLAFLGADLFKVTNERIIRCDIRILQTETQIRGSFPVLIPPSKMKSLGIF